MKSLGTILLIAGIILFVVSATTGTISGYQGANGLYYANPGAVGSNEWMEIPGLIMAAIGFILRKIDK